MGKLYLVRKENKEIVGPLTAEDVEQKAQRLEISFQDEICGHLKPWVMIEDENALRRGYPEIYGILFKAPTSNYTALVLDKIKKKSSSLNYYVASFCLIVALGAFFTGRWYYFSMQNIAASAQQLYEDKRFSELETLLRGEIPKLVNKTPEDLKAVLPYLRWLAIKDKGEIPGVEPRQLYGRAILGQPQDCSVSFWTEVFKSSVGVWGSFFKDEALPKAPWLQVLSWHPLWIAARREPSWLYPKNPFAACVHLAHEAFAGLAARPDFREVVDKKYGEEGGRYRAAILGRLSFLADQINHTNFSQGIPEGTTLLDQWTCLERAQAREGLDSCLKRKAVRSQEMIDYLHFRYTYMATFYIISKDTVDDADFRFLEKATLLFARPEPLARLAFVAEKKLVEQFIYNRGNRVQAFQYLTQIFPNVDYSIWSR